MNLTLIVYQEGNYYYDRDDDDHLFDCGSQNIHFSKDEEEIATHWSEYLLKNKYLKKVEEEHRILLLLNGIPYNELEWGTKDENGPEVIYDRIKASAEAKIADRLHEKKLREEQEALAKRAQEEKRQKELTERKEKEDLAKYLELQKRFGGFW